MEKFPEIKKEQVVLLRVDPPTGHILDETFKLYRDNNNQKAYSIFKSLEEAIEYANNFLDKTSQYEFSIYDYQNNFIQTLGPYKSKRSLE